VRERRLHWGRRSLFFIHARIMTVALPAAARPRNTWTISMNGLRLFANLQDLGATIAVWVFHLPTPMVGAHLRQ
jgi:hypothetical protein